MCRIYFVCDSAAWACFFDILRSVEMESCRVSAIIDERLLYASTRNHILMIFPLLEDMNFSPSGSLIFSEPFISSECEYCFRYDSLTRLLRLQCRVLSKMPYEGYKRDDAVVGQK